MSLSDNAISSNDHHHTNMTQNQSVGHGSSHRHSQNKNGVQSLEIGLSVLDILINYHHPMMLRDIAQVAQMHPAKVHRYLVSLIHKGYARQFEDGRYGLGSRINSLSYCGLNHNNVLERLTMVATEIKELLNCAVQVAKWFSEGPIIIQSVEPDSPISIITRIGSRMPLTTSATGQLFASYQPEAIIKPLVIAEWQDQQSNKVAKTAEASNSPVNSSQWQQFTQRQAEIRTQGYATVSGDILMGINAITIPVLIPSTSEMTKSKTTDAMNQVSNSAIDYALTIIGTSEQLPSADSQQIVDKILTIAKRYQVTR